MYHPALFGHIMIQTYNGVYVSREITLMHSLASSTQARSPFMSSFPVACLLPLVSHKPFRRMPNNTDMADD